MNKAACAGLLIFLTSAGALYGSDVFEFSGDRFSSVMSQGREFTVLSGNAGIVSDTTIISADRIELYGDDYRYARCTGHVRIRDNEKGILIEADRMNFDRKEEISRIEGAVVMEDLRNEVIIKGNYLEYSGKTEKASVHIGVRILKEDMTGRSEYAKFSRDDQILEMSGLPVAYWKGDEYRALKITINLDTDEIYLEGKVSGTIVTGSEAEESGEDDESGEADSEKD